jgi:hypothetical protein
MNKKHPATQWLEDEAVKEAAARIYQLQAVDEAIKVAQAAEMEKEAALEPLSDEDEEALILEQIRLAAMEDEQLKLANGFMTDPNTGEDVYVPDLFADGE